MKLLCLNTWGGRAGIADLLSFFEQYQDVDVFCLQEMWSGGEHTASHVAAGRDMQGVDFQLVKSVSHVLKDHVVYFRPQYLDFFGVATFVKKTITVKEEGICTTYREAGYISQDDIADHSRIFQHVTLETPQGLRTIMNTHGAWQPGGKKDTPERLEQSDRIVAFAKTLSHPYVLCGDFNLLPQTESVKKLERAGLKNLITEYDIPSTRTSFYKKADAFADYVFTSPDIQVDEFRVLSEEVSDHRALFLSFN